MKLAWFAIGFLASTGLHMAGFVTRTKKLQNELKNKKIEMGDDFWKWWVGF